MQHGWSIDAVVSSALFSDRVWSGDESAHWQRWLDEFGPYRKGGTKESRSLAEAATSRLIELRGSAIVRERQEAVGRLR